MGNRLRSVWRRIDKLKRNNTKSQKDTILINNQGGLISTIDGKLKISTQRLRGESYRTPEYFEYPLTSHELWTNQEQMAPEIPNQFHN